MTQQSTAREALIADLIGDVGQLIGRVEALAPAMDEARQTLLRASTDLLGQMAAFEGRMAVITENAKVQAVRHIARRADEVARQSLEAPISAMNEAGQNLFRSEIGPALQRLAMPLQQLARKEPPWKRGLSYAVAAAAASAATWVLAAYRLLL